MRRARPVITFECDPAIGHFHLNRLGLRFFSGLRVSVAVKVTRTNRGAKFAVSSFSSSRLCVAFLV